MEYTGRSFEDKCSAIGVENHEKVDGVNTMTDTLDNNVGTETIDIGDQTEGNMKSSEYPTLDLSDECNLEEDLELIKSNIDDIAPEHEDIHGRIDKFRKSSKENVINGNVIKPHSSEFIDSLSGLVRGWWYAPSKESMVNFLENYET